MPPSILKLPEVLTEPEVADGPGACMHELPALLHIETHGLEGGIEHASVGGNGVRVTLILH
jgi:hypothetical protein